MTQRSGASFLFCFFFLSLPVFAQPFTHQDTLRGSITPERAWWDLLHYDLQVEVDIENKSITGSNAIRFKVTSDPKRMQIDLQAPMQIIKVMREGRELEVEHDGNAHFVQFKEPMKVGSRQEITVFFEGQPREAVHAPWDGGFTWTTDEDARPFIATSNQGIGASLWWPCKDHPQDEPDEGMTMSYTVPKDLVAVGNGRLVKSKRHRGAMTYVWEVKNPINNYGVNLNIGDYVEIKDKYNGEKGRLDISYYVLRYNESKAREHFKEAIRTLEAFEYWFGPYPFYEDSYKLVEVPYLGMEHQSSVTYGNGYQNGYLGSDLSMTGWGLKWDFIIVHESGHEWFANNITHADQADMWIHEGFTAYSEALFTEYHYGKEAGAAYVRGVRLLIENKGTMIAPYGVNAEGEDLYYKGSNLLHTLRQWIGDDEKWRAILRGLNRDFYHQTVTTRQVEDYIAEKSGLDLSVFFDQYLRTSQIPVLEYGVLQGKLIYRWTNCLPGFELPLKVYVGDQEYWIHPKSEWNLRALTIDVPDVKTLSVDPDCYIYPVLLRGE